ncbi:MAG: hypothetical protein M3R21_03560 [Candidatus Dormibacteraeota bacterium]|nr:hypothetical protein [Candidatus Dormibacteraeota bacterium]
MTPDPTIPHCGRRGRALILAALVLTALVTHLIVGAVLCVHAFLIVWAIRFLYAILIVLAIRLVQAFLMVRAIHITGHDGFTLELGGNSVRLARSALAFIGVPRRLRIE